MVKVITVSFATKMAVQNRHMCPHTHTYTETNVHTHLHPDIPKQVYRHTCP